MYKFSVEELIKSTKGKLLKGNIKDVITNIAIDSREIKEDTLYIPIIGESHDGHKFLEDAYNNGCKTFLIDSKHKFDKNDINLIRVKDTTKAFGAIAKYHKNKFDFESICITGSVGKTSTRDMVASVVKEKYKTLKNEGNYNNEIGIPKTLLNLEKDVEKAVLEIGMSFKGEIKYLSELIEPKIGIISNIGMSHIENFKNQDGIYNAKMEITTKFDQNSILIVNGDDKYLNKLKNKKLKYKVLSYGFNEDNDIYCKSYKINEESIDFVCEINKKEEKFTIPTPAKHNILNAMAAILVGQLLNIDLKDIKKGLKTFSLTKMRLDIYKTDKYRIIDDTYNASSDSMISALDVLSNYKTRRVAILGDIKETGKYTEEIHRKVGKNTKDKADVLVTIGSSSKYIYDESIENGFERKNIYHFDTKEEFIKKMNKIILEEDTILLKASRSMELEKIIEHLK